jgi:hypothetical protein
MADEALYPVKGVGARKRAGAWILVPSPRSPLNLSSAREGIGGLFQ